MSDAVYVDEVSDWSPNAESTSSVILLLVVLAVGVLKVLLVVSSSIA